MTDEEQALLVELAHHPAWGVLKAEARLRKEREFGRMVTQLMAGTYIDEKQLHWTRGFFAGMDFLIRDPAIEAGKLQRALQEREEVIA